jgi:hypothetical protein
LWPLTTNCQGNSRRNSRPLLENVVTGVVVAQKIVSGHLEPYEGTKAIWPAYLAVDDPEFHDLDAFVYAKDEYEDRPEDRAHFANEIVEEAKRWSTASASHHR